jgi:hypothetical protein
VLSLADSLGWTEYQRDTIDSRRRAQALLVAEELLLWHQVRGDGIFEGIEARHIACRTLSLPSGLELPGSGRRTGDDAVRTSLRVEEGSGRRTLSGGNLVRTISAMVEAVKFDKSDGVLGTFQ